MFRPPAFEELPTVDGMVAAMDRTVAGLEKFKRRLAVIIRRHLVAAALDRPWHPTNVLIIGPSGGGKTFTLVELLKGIDALWCDAALTEYSDVGYAGRDLTSAYLGLTVEGQRELVNGKHIPAAEHRTRAERWGIILLDEFDKLRTNPIPVPGERQVGKVLQYELLKLVEGSSALVKQYEDDRGFFFNTSHVLHIAMGAFAGLNQVVARDLGVDAEENLYEQVSLENLIHYGFIPELVGRFSTVLTLPPLRHDHLARILREQIVPKWKSMVADEGVELIIDEGAINGMANIGIRQLIGARSLEPILDEHLWQRIGEARPGDRIVLPAHMVGTSSALLERRVAA